MAAVCRSRDTTMSWPSRVPSFSVASFIGGMSRVSDDRGNLFYDGESSCPKQADLRTRFARLAVPRSLPSFQCTVRAPCALPMPSIARSDADPADPLDASDDDTADAGEEKLRSGIQSLEVLTHEPRAMMLRDLAQRAGMSPAKAHRYLVSFLRLGVVAQDALSGRYELGGFALQLGLARLARVDGVKLARIALAELRDRLDLTVGIAVWGNQGPTVVHWMESSHPAKASLKLGDVMPLLSSATGLLFAAYLPASKTAAMLERELTDSRRSSHMSAPRTHEEVATVLAQVREH